MKTPQFFRFLYETLRIRVLSRAQQAATKVLFCGIDPVDLPRSERDLVRQMIGDVERIPPQARSVLIALKGARVSFPGTWGCSLYLLFLGLTLDLSGLGLGEVAFGVIVCPDLRLSRQALRYIAGAVDSTPELSDLVVAQTSDSITLRRPDGHLIVFECLPASKGGAAGRGRTLFGFLLDEALFLRDPDTSELNDRDTYRPLRARLTIPGSVGMVISTAWAEGVGLLNELHAYNFGAPKTAVAGTFPTLLMRDDEQIQAVVAEARVVDPDNAAREFDCVSLSGDGIGYFGSAVDLSIAKEPIPMFPPRLVTYTGAADLAFSADHTGVAVVSSVVGAWNGAKQERAPRITRVHFIESWPPGSPRETARRLKREVCSVFGLKRLNVDQFEGRSWRELAADEGLNVRIVPWRGGSDDGDRYQTEKQLRSLNKSHAYSIVRREMLLGQLQIPNDPAFIRELRSVRIKPLPAGGERIEVPRTKGGHGDRVSAFVMAAALAIEKPAQLPAAWRTPQEMIEAELREQAMEDFMTAVSCGGGGRHTPPRF